MDVRIMQQNSERIPVEELQRYKGMHVALSADGSQIVASGDSLAALEADIAAKGLDPEQVWFDYIGGDEIELGGVEFFE
jgi:hypothetical protein